MLRKTAQAIVVSGACTAGAIYQYTRNVQPLSVPPPDTLLEDMSKRGLTTDCIELRVVDTMGSTHISNDQFVRAFLRSRVFSLERFLLSRAGGEFAKHAFTNDEINEFQLEVGDHVSSIFQVVDKRGASNELVMRWDERVQGHSWLQVAPGTLRFGTACNPHTDSLNAVHTYAFAVMYRLHLIYSRVLLVAARNQLARDLADR